jgi:hypothetical protein
MILEKDFQIAAGVTSPPFQLRNCHETIRDFQRVNAIFDDWISKLFFPQYLDEFSLDEIYFFLTLSRLRRHSLTFRPQLLRSSSADKRRLAVLTIGIPKIG